MKKYNYRTTFVYNGKRYAVYADTMEELYVKKADKKRELEKNVIVYDGKTTVDTWAEEVFDILPCVRRPCFQRIPNPMTRAVYTVCNADNKIVADNRPICIRKTFPDITCDVPQRIP